MEELEVLESIYLDDIKTEKDDSGHPVSIQILLHPATGDELDKRYVCMTLTLKIPQKYPEEVPDIEITNPRGLAEEEVQSLLMELEKLAGERIGGEMLFEIIELAKESLTEGNVPYCPCTICYEHFTEEDIFTKTDCYHYFHNHCLRRFIEHQLIVLEEAKAGLIKHAQNNKLDEKVRCPVCREEITYDLDFLQSENYDKTRDEISFRPTDEIKTWQKEMSELLRKQKEKGGIIDVEAEKNRYLLTESDTDVPIILPDAVKKDSEDEKPKIEKDNNPSKKSGPFNFNHRPERGRGSRHKDYHGYRHDYRSDGNRPRSGKPVHHESSREDNSKSYSRNKNQGFERREGNNRENHPKFQRKDQDSKGRISQKDDMNEKQKEKGKNSESQVKSAENDSVSKEIDSKESGYKMHLKQDEKEINAKKESPQHSNSQEKTKKFEDDRFEKKSQHDRPYRSERNNQHNRRGFSRGNNSRPYSGRQGDRRDDLRGPGSQAKSPRSDGHYQRDKVSKEDEIEGQVRLGDRQDNIRGSNSKPSKTDGHYQRDKVSKEDEIQGQGKLGNRQDNIRGNNSSKTDGHYQREKVSNEDSKDKIQRQGSHDEKSSRSYLGRQGDRRDNFKGSNSKSSKNNGHYETDKVSKESKENSQAQNMVDENQKQVDGKDEASLAASGNCDLNDKNLKTLKDDKLQTSTSLSGEHIEKVSSSSKEGDKTVITKSGKDRQQRGRGQRRHAGHDQSDQDRGSDKSKHDHGYHRNKNYGNHYAGRKDRHDYDDGYDNDDYDYHDNQDKGYNQHRRGQGHSNYRGGQGHSHYRGGHRNYGYGQSQRERDSQTPRHEHENLRKNEIKQGNLKESDKTSDSPSDKHKDRDKEHQTVNSKPSVHKKEISTCSSDKPKPPSNSDKPKSHSDSDNAKNSRSKTSAPPGFEVKGPPPGYSEKSVKPPPGF